MGVLLRFAERIEEHGEAAVKRREIVVTLCGGFRVC